eukprot:Gregarina_sp_Poly_1__5657@NODE_2984_length_1481_cov_58_467468_g1885_i0_p1_GENE_NODE_2984_length_1481_cov_58_467468_g1885_i0NODE_2984_length_1481_cov_58_467468_g1885_i0_p1_ORF_typecomplete_len188_score25_77REV/PF00424_18/0_048_NODE_2984_length_1481_cov_58_467468_g1885_i0121684
MKGVQLEQQKPASGPLCNALISCSQILVGNEQYAIQCLSPLPPLDIFEICQVLMDYKKRSYQASFQWASNDLIRIVDRKDYEPARIEPGADSKATLKDLNELFYDDMRCRNLKLVEQENEKTLEQAARNLRDNWRRNWKHYWKSSSSTFQELLGQPAKTHEAFQLFYDYQLLFLRSKSTRIFGNFEN